MLLAGLGGAAWTPVRPSAMPARDLVYPPVRSSVIFSHASHAARGTPCSQCHSRAATSTTVADRLVPTGSACDGCHGSKHAGVDSAGAPLPTADASCAKCHGNTQPAPAQWPSARLSAFSHKKHGGFGMSCSGCHGDVAHAELATEKHMPSMALCQSCHAPGSKSPLAAPRQSSCTSCHEGTANGRIRTEFPEGKLRPQHMGAMLSHNADFSRTHASAARSNPSSCTSCHAPESCTDCHAGRTKPQSVHAGDVLRTHGVEAKLREAQACASCHRTESFCVPCHAATGVAANAPAGTRASGRMHGDKNAFVYGRGPASHAVQAAQNLPSCTSCHAPQDCTSCHATRGIGGGVNPHGPGFADRCAALARANSASCTQCHLPGDSKLGACR